ncbi:hypothetical protein [Pseudomonas sp. W4I3]|nr:hypothetical protein [Pseudomonas sp. W4I3]MDQ0737912.1 hypothetical protein [Pseudomonas sp. W4I3]
MTAKIRNSASWSDTLKSRKENLTALIKVVDIKAGKIRTPQELTKNLLK